MSSSVLPSGISLRVNRAPQQIVSPRLVNGLNTAPRPVSAPAAPVPAQRAARVLAKIKNPNDAPSQESQQQPASPRTGGDRAGSVRRSSARQGGVSLSVFRSK